MTQIAERSAERTLAQVYAQLYPAEVAAELGKLKEGEILSALEGNILPTVVRVFMRFDPPGGGLGRSLGVPWLVSGP